MAVWSKILLPNGEDVCLDQIRAGMAWHYQQFESEQTPSDRQAYGAAKDAARESNVGLWERPASDSSKPSKGHQTKEGEESGATI